MLIQGSLHTLTFFKARFQENSKGYYLRMFLKTFFKQLGALFEYFHG